MRPHSFQIVLLSATRSFVTFSACLIILGIPGYAQAQPQGAHVNLYFPHLVDGGDAATKWQTTFIFTNPSSSSIAYVDLYLYRDNGSPMLMDLGSGALGRHSFAVPSSGSKTLRSRVTSSTTVGGWAVANSTISIQGIASYRQLVNNAPKQEISAQPTLPAFQYLSPANRFLGVAIANVFYDTPITVTLTVKDSGGTQIGSTKVTVPALGHTSFFLWEKLSGLPETYGTLQIRGETIPKDRFIAWTLGSDSSSTWSSLPPGAYSWPVAHWDRIWLVYLGLLDVAKANPILSFTSIPRLEILTGQEVNAWARADGTIGISLGLSQLISDSPSELAFLIGHEMGHILQFQNNNRLVLYPLNRELDADAWGTLLTLLAGYDPYGALGVFGKLTVACGGAGIIKQLFDDLLDPHTSFTNRMDFAYSALDAVCTDGEGHL